VLEDRSLHSLEVLQGALRRSSNEVIFKPKAIFKRRRSSNKVIFKALCADLQAKGDLQTK
jgi:hypothetical protein